VQIVKDLFSLLKLFKGGFVHRDVKLERSSYSPQLMSVFIIAHCCEQKPTDCVHWWSWNFVTMKNWSLLFYISTTSAGSTLTEFYSHDPFPVAKFHTFIYFLVVELWHFIKKSLGQN